MVYANYTVNKEYVNFQAICEAILFLYLSGTITGLLQKTRMFSSQWTLKAFNNFYSKKIKLMNDKMGLPKVMRNI